MRHPQRVPSRSAIAGLAVVLMGAPLASHAPRVSISGEISADNDVFIQIRQEGTVVTSVHPDIHELACSLNGQMVEVGRLTLDLSTGDGFFSAEAEFVGTALGGQPGTAMMKVHGQVRNFGETTRGHFVVFNGRDGLAGIHATGTYDYVLGQGGKYQGVAHIDERH